MVKKSDINKMYEHLEVLLIETKQEKEDFEDTHPGMKSAFCNGKINGINNAINSMNSITGISIPLSLQEEQYKEYNKL